MVVILVVPVARVVLPVPERGLEPEQEPGLALVAVAPQLLPELGPLLVVAPEPESVVVGQPR